MEVKWKVVEKGVARLPLLRVRQPYVLLSELRKP